MIIKKVEVKGKLVKVFLSNGDSFSILLETYLNNNILIDDEITVKRVEELKKIDLVSVGKLELLNKIGKKRLSKNECIKFLKQFDIGMANINSIIDEFEKNYLINDYELAQIIVDYCLSNKKGINKIKEKLIDREIDINYDEFLKEYLDQERYENNVKSQLEKYSRLANNKSRVEFRRYLKIKLLENGYVNEDFNEFISDYDIDENEVIYKEIVKFFKNKEINRENIAKITKKLLSKGFNYDIIKSVIRECEQDETY